MTRDIFVRGLGLVYLWAFLSLVVEVDGLFGSDGLAPISDYLARAASALGGPAPLRIPSLFWLAASDVALRAACWIGAALSVAVVAGWIPRAGLALSWALYLSFVSVGDPFLSFQWDSLLLETGLLAIAFAPSSLRLGSPNARRAPTMVRWLLWWLLFRLMFFSGWVKLASDDPTWWGLTALAHHFETQPLPSWTAWYAHALPDLALRAATLATFAIELILPFAIVLGRRGRAVAAAGFVGLQVAIAATGNYGFFGLLTVVLCIPLLDDDQSERLVPAAWRGRSQPPLAAPSRLATATSLLLAVLVVSLTVPQSVARLRGDGSPLPQALQTLRRHLAPFRPTGHYGLFAVMTVTRPEVVIEGSEDGVTWKEYTLPWKPGPLGRAPGFVQPLMPRLDWQLWFDGLRLERMLEGGARARGLVTPLLLRRLRENSPAVRGLLDADPFPEGAPAQLRWSLYDYRFTDPAERRATGDWWVRRRLGGGPGS